MPHPRLVLSSTSPHRRLLLERLAIPFEPAAPSFREPGPPAGHVTPEASRELAQRNSAGKARSLVETFPRSLIIGSDQICECEGRTFSKAGTEERAVQQLLFLAGREHRLHTAVTIVEAGTGREESATVTNTLKMRVLSEERLRAYVRRERPLDSAGSYYAEGLGILLFEHLRGDDPTAILGLPLIALGDLLERFGLSPLDPRGWER